MLPLFKACQEIHGEVTAEKFRAVSVVVSAECPFMGCVWALPFHTVALVMLETMCCYLSILELMGDLEKGTALQSP